MTWNDLKEVFARFHSKEITKKQMTAKIREYQLSNGIKPVRYSK